MCEQNSKGLQWGLEYYKSQQITKLQLHTQIESWHFLYDFKTYFLEPINLQKTYYNTIQMATML